MITKITIEISGVVDDERFKNFDKYLTDHINSMLDIYEVDDSDLLTYRKEVVEDEL